MLRPATPLAILLFVAFALLLLSVLSTPIIKAIPLGLYKPDGGDVNFGVFGYCKGNSCSPIEIGYDTCKSIDSLVCRGWEAYIVSSEKLLMPCQQS